MTGPVFRLDDRMAEARIIDEPARNDAFAGFEHVFTYDFDTADELKSAAGKMKPTVRDGVLVVEHAPDDYLRNASPIAIVTDDIGEIIVRVKATKGTRFSLGWSPKAEPEQPWRWRVDIPLIADGKFHNYTINARNALRRGLDEGNELHFLALQPSDVPGDKRRGRFHPLSLHAQQVPAQAARRSLRGGRRRNAAGDVDAAAADAGVQHAHPGAGSAPELRDGGARQALARAVRSSGRERLEDDRAAQPDASMRRVRGTMRVTTCAPGLDARSHCDSPSMAKPAAWDSGAIPSSTAARPSRCAS